MAQDPGQYNFRMGDTIRAIFYSSVAPITCANEKEFIQTGFTFNSTHYKLGYYTKFYRAMHEQGDHLVMKTMNLAELKPYRKKKFLEEGCIILDYVGKKEAIANVVGVLGLFLIGDTLYVFMRHYSELSIHHKMRMVARFKETLVQRWLKQLGSVCEYLHKKSIVHRSIRPEHLLLDEYDNLNLTGWTRSIFLLNPISGLLNKCPREYRCLKHNHLPPECFCSDYSPAQIDQWSFGVMMVTLATNRHLFKPNEQTRNNFEQQWKQFFLEHGALLNPKIVSILDRLFRMQVDDRVSLETILKLDYFAEYKEVSTALQSTTKPQARKDFPSASNNPKPPAASKQPKFQPTPLKLVKSSKSNGTTSANRNTSPKSLVMSSNEYSSTKSSINPNWIQVDISSSDKSNFTKEDNMDTSISTMKPKSRDLKANSSFFGRVDGIESKIDEQSKSGAKHEHENEHS